MGRFACAFTHCHFLRNWNSLLILQYFLFRLMLRLIRFALIYNCLQNYLRRTLPLLSHLIIYLILAFKNLCCWVKIRWKWNLAFCAMHAIMRRFLNVSWSSSITHTAFPNLTMYKFQKLLSKEVFIRKAVLGIFCQGSHFL